MAAPPLPEGIADSALAEIANRLHSHAIHLLRRARQADRETGLSPERLSLLSVLAYVGPRTVGELASIEMVSAPAISRTLKALEADGLTRRVRSRSDRRQVRIHATEAGRQLMERGRSARLRLIIGELSTLDATELARLGSALDLLAPASSEG